MSITTDKVVANLEEVQPRAPSRWEELPLILFTLLAQMAAGGFWAMLWMFPSLWTMTSAGTTFLRLLPPLIVGVCLSGGALASLAHLGTKRRALNMLRNLRRSWLSREVLLVGLFGLGWLVITLDIALSGRAAPEWMAVTAALGLGLVYSMAQVYRLPAAPGWNTRRVNAGFLVSALLLGLTLMAALLSYEPYLTGRQVPSIQWSMIGTGIFSLLLAQLLLIPRSVSRDRLSQIRRGFIGVAMILAGSFVLFSASGWISLLLLPFVALEEGVGRWSFYRARMG